MMCGTMGAHQPSRDVPRPMTFGRQGPADIVTVSVVVYVPARDPPGTVSATSIVCW